MASFTVDLGYYSFRYTHLIRALNGEMGYGVSLPLWDSYMEDIRDRWRFVLENRNVGKDWRVGRIFRWLGDSGGYGSGFLIERLDGFGNKTDDEFLITYAGPRSGQTSQRATLVHLFGPNATNYYVGFDGSTSNGHITIHYNYAALSDSYEIGAGADHAPPLVAPHTNPAGFFPDPILQGVPFLKGMSQNALDTGGGFGSELSDHAHLVVVNHEVPFIALYLNSIRDVRIRKLCVIGKIIEPSDPLDLRTEGFFYARPNPTSRWNSTNDYTYVEAISPLTGQSMDFVAYVHGNFSSENQPPIYDQALWYRDKVFIARSDVGSKGVFNQDIIAIDGTNAKWIGSGDNSVGEIGYGDHGKTWQTAYGRSMKTLVQLSTPWVDGQSPPFGNWPKYPQEMSEEFA